MLYFIGHVIQGEAGDYHNALRKEISKKFHTHLLHEKIPPHVTLKAPFKTKSAVEIEKLLEAFASKQTPSTITLNGFGHFGNRVIYINAHVSTEGIQTSKDLTQELMQLEWLHFERHEINKKFHTTVAVRDIQRKFDRIWNFIKDDEPCFEISFDSIALLKHDGKRWNIHSEFYFKTTNS